MDVEKCNLAKFPVTRTLVTPIEYDYLLISFR